MKSYALNLVSTQTGLNAKLNTLREYLQHYTLGIMQDQGVFRTTAFLGGTALRFIYGIPRFSEDLDFSLTQPAGYDFEELMKKVETELAMAGYNVSVNPNKEKTVHSSFIKFEGLLYEAEISPLKNQKFSIKVEIDTNPPEGASLRKEIVSKYIAISFMSYDLTSLFAGKLHALLSRKYTKGRDFFDLGWYLSKWKDLSPNFILLENALKQTGWKGLVPSKENWKMMIQKVVSEADWNKVKQDVENFLENPRDAEIFTQENVLKLLKGD